MPTFRFKFIQLKASVSHGIIAVTGATYRRFALGSGWAMLPDSVVVPQPATSDRGAGGLQSCQSRGKDFRSVSCTSWCHQESMLCSTRWVSSSCSGALTSDMALGILEKTINETQLLTRPVTFNLASVHAPYAAVNTNYMGSLSQECLPVSWWDSRQCCCSLTSAHKHKRHVCCLMPFKQFRRRIQRASS